MMHKMRISDKNVVKNYYERVTQKFDWKSTQVVNIATMEQVKNLTVNIKTIKLCCKKTSYFAINYLLQDLSRNLMQIQQMLRLDPFRVSYLYICPVRHWPL